MEPSAVLQDSISLNNWVVLGFILQKGASAPFLFLEVYRSCRLKYSAATTE